MPVVAIADIEIRAKMDQFDRDLAATTSKLNTLNQSMTKATEVQNKHNDSVDAATEKYNKLKSSMTSFADSVGSAVTATFKGLADQGAALTDTIGSVFDNTKAKLTEFNAVIAGSAAVSVSTDTFQRMTKSAAALGIEINVTKDALQRFAAVTKEDFGGSTLNRTLLSLQQAGNFIGNSNLLAVRTATSVEQRYKAVVGLINEAAQKGERLAAIKLAETFLPPEAVDRLRAGSDFLDQWAQKAGKIADTELISNKQLADAAELTRRMDAVIKAWTKMPEPTLDLLSGSTSLYRIWVNLAEVGTKLASTSWWTSWVKGSRDVRSTFPEAEVRTWTELVEKMSPGGAIGPGTSGQPINMGKDFVGPLQAGFAAPTDVDLLSRSMTYLNTAMQQHRDAVKALKEVYGVPGSIFSHVGEVLDTNIRAVTRYNEVIKSNIALDQFSIDLGRKGGEELKDRTAEIDALMKFRERAAERAKPITAGGLPIAPGAIPGFGQIPEMAGMTAVFGVVIAKTKEQERELLLLDSIDKKVKNSLVDLSVAMGDYKNVLAATTAVQGFYRDQSTEMSGILLHMEERIIRRNALEKARAATIGQSVAQQAKQRTETQLFEIAQLAAEREGKVLIDAQLMSTEEYNAALERSNKTGKDWLHVTDDQKKRWSELGTEAGEAARHVLQATINLRENQRYIELGNGLTKEEVRIYNELKGLQEFSGKSMREILESDLAGRIKANNAIERSIDLDRRLALSRKGYSQEQIEIANKYMDVNGSTAEQIKKAIDSQEGQTEQRLKDEDREMAILRDRFMITQKIRSEDKAIADALKARFGPQPKQVQEALDSGFGQGMKENKQKEQLNALLEQTKILKANLSENDAAIVEKLKEQYSGELKINEILGSRQAKELQLQNQLKVTKEIQYDYLKATIGLTDQELIVVNQLQASYAKTAEGLTRLRNSQDASVLRYIALLKQVSNMGTSFGTTFLNDFVTALESGNQLKESMRQGLTSAVRGLQSELITVLTKAFFQAFVTPMLAHFLPSIIAGGTTTATAIGTGATTAAGELTLAGATVSGAIIAGSAEASVSLTAAGVALGSAMVAGATTAATILTAAKLPLLGFQQGGIVPMLTAQQGIIVPTPPSGLGTGVPILAHPGEEVIRRDDPRHQLNGGKDRGNESSPQINLTLNANGRMTKSDIREHGMTIAKMVGEIFTEHHATRPKY